MRILSFAAWTAAWTMSLLACAPGPVETRELPLVQISGAPPNATGELRFPVETHEKAELRVALAGLPPQTRYVLCLNPWHHDSPTSTELGRIELPGWPLGAIYSNPAGYEQGYWNFATVQTDAAGRFDHTFELPLPPLEYQIHFLVKTAEGSIPILQSDIVLLSVIAPAYSRWLAGTALVLAIVPLVWRARARRRQPTADGTAPLSEARSKRAELKAATQVERAREEGVLRHAPGYSWVEIHGRRKSFRPRQALVFQVLCERDPDCHGLLQEEIIKAWEETYAAKRANPVRVRDIFRASPDEPGDFIVRVPGAASAYRLRLEAEISAEPSLEDDDGAPPSGSTS